MMQSIGSLQKKYSIGSFELLSKTAPIQAISLLVFGPFVDYSLSGNSILKYSMSYGFVVSGAILNIYVPVNMCILLLLSCPNVMD